jgi:hypothetical protein
MSPKWRPQWPHFLLRSHYWLFYYWLSYFSNTNLPAIPLLRCGQRFAKRFGVSDFWLLRNRGIAAQFSCKFLGFFDFEAKNTPQFASFKNQVFRVKWGWTTWFWLLAVRKWCRVAVRRMFHCWNVVSTANNAKNKESANYKSFKFSCN